MPKHHRPRKHSFLDINCPLDAQPCTNPECTVFSGVVYCATQSDGNRSPKEARMARKRRRQERKMEARAKRGLGLGIPNITRPPVDDKTYEGMVQSCMPRIPVVLLATNPIDPTMPVQTRDGRCAWLREIDPRKTWPVIAMTYGSDGKEHLLTATLTGSFSGRDSAHPQDLFNVRLEDWLKGYANAKAL